MLSGRCRADVVASCTFVGVAGESVQTGRIVQASVCKLPAYKPGWILMQLDSAAVAACGVRSSAVFC